MERMASKLRSLEEIGELLRSRRLTTEEASRASSNAFQGQAGRTMEELLRDPAVSIADLGRVEPGLLAFAPASRAEAELDVKYAGYVRRQDAQVERFRRMESASIPADFPYHSVEGLSAESREKLAKVRPLSVGQASRIAGVRPSDLSLLLLHLARARRP